MSLLGGNWQPGCALGHRVMMPGCPLTPPPALLKGLIQSDGTGLG